MFTDLEDEPQASTSQQFPSQDGGGAEMPEDFDITDEELTTLFEEYEKEREELESATATKEPEVNQAQGSSTFSEDDYLWLDDDDIDFPMS